MDTVNEKLRDADIAHQVDLQQYGNGVVRRMIALLNKTDAALFAQLTEALERLPAESFTVERLEQLLYSIRSLNLQAYRALNQALIAELADFTAYEIGHQYTLFSSTIPAQIIAQVEIATVSAEQVYAAAMSRPFQGRLLKEWASSIEVDRMARIRDTIRMGYVENQSISKIVQRLRGTRAKGYGDGVIEIDRRNAEAVVRTAISHTAAFTRDRFLKANGSLIKALVWTSTLDSRTSEGCRIRDGKQYTPEQHLPIGHKVPWEAGPGALHWNAVCAGTSVKTVRGDLSIESVVVGDEVLTHSGEWRRVTATRAKRSEGGIVRAIHTQAGRVLRATDDHPVLVAADGWKFVGALEVGDNLLCDKEQLRVVGAIQSVVGAAAEYGPPISDETHVALKRAFELVAADVNFEGDPQVWASEIEDRASCLVLGDPSVIEDQSRLHHLLSLADALKKLGRNGFGDLLALRIRDYPAALAQAGLKVGSSLGFGGADALVDARDSGGVVGGHSLGMCSQRGVRILGQAPGPVTLAGRSGSTPAFKVKADLLPLTADRDAVAPSVGRQASVGEIVAALDSSQGVASVDMLIKNEGAEGWVFFGHDPIVSLEVQTYNGNLYDLEVDGDCSYVASGIVVSNCRSTSLPITKSWKELGGVDIESLSPTDRASMDGVVPAETTYAAWLLKQSAARQDEILGPSRGRLLRDGKLTLDRFYNDKGRALTLEQMRERDFAAFEKAGM